MDAVEQGRQREIRRVCVALGMSAVLALMGWCVRRAEFDQIGSANLTSMWIFVAAGLCLYYAVLKGFVLLRRKNFGRPPPSA